MITTVAALVVLALLIFMTYAGVRDGLFFSAYALMRNMIAFMAAVTFCQPLAMLFSWVITDSYPAPQYFVPLGYAAAFGITFALGRWLKIRYTYPDAQCPLWVDRIAGGVAGFMNAYVVTGMLLILWTLLPFARYIPGDHGRLDPPSAIVDSGAVMLRTYDLFASNMPGNTPFLLEDEEVVEDHNNNGRAEPGESFDDVNGNGEWDRGWLWRYRNHAEVLAAQLEPLRVPTGGEDEESSD
jgi:hypothetical protein